MKILLLYDLDNDWNDIDKKEVLTAVENLGAALAESGRIIKYVEVRNERIAELLSAYSPDEYIVFNWCESIPGLRRSEALAAEMIEKSGFIYTGASPEALRISEDKCRVNTLLNEKNIPVPKWKIISEPEDYDWNFYPAIIKSATEHCSFGMTSKAVIANCDELKRQVDFFLNTYQQPALVEDFIGGREFHVSLWGNGEIEILPIAEMDFSAFNDIHDKLCSYEAKFNPESEHYSKIQTIIPARITQEEEENLKYLCRESFKIVGCRDYARIDIRERDGVFYVLDVNPNPDISPDTSMYYAAELSGYTYSGFGSRIVELALKRYPLK